ncbi:MAG: hypothetical protein K6T81_17145 [Alicyclobacillus macrosporangiidus]|uniref:hypothetical protein n=1 Tax=Alicyclobacillus macrosporangiidus TaxID=392015 RepID=UPI0026EDD05E|nr:hypothetical protein [Alicyclobacillus macrosporangiidus]MCL6600439.1 hypothetical protein [Alicyclobacillus macrosporangiidus]
MAVVNELCLADPDPDGIVRDLYLCEQLMARRVTVLHLTGPTGGIGCVDQSNVSPYRVRQARDNAKIASIVPISFADNINPYFTASVGDVATLNEEEIHLERGCCRGGTHQKSSRTG